MLRQTRCYMFFMLLISSCTTNNITGRSQLILIPEAQLMSQSVVAYRQFLQSNIVLSASSGANAAMVKRVGNRIKDAITSYYTKKGMEKELAGYQWEFNLVDKNEVNAWCMPGGKVVVYTGLLDVTQNETALAIVLGHEITHAVAHHGNERMSQVLLAQGIQVAGDMFTKEKQRTNQIFNAVFAPSAQLGFLLPNSRKQEYESDHYGLLFAAMAGYDPREAIPFWKRMSQSGGAKPPEFLATHPSDENRISNLQSYMNEALEYYNNK